MSKNKKSKFADKHSTQIRSEYLKQQKERDARKVWHHLEWSCFEKEKIAHLQLLGIWNESFYDEVKEAFLKSAESSFNDSGFDDWVEFQFLGVYDNCDRWVAIAVLVESLGMELSDFFRRHVLEEGFLPYFDQLVAINQLKMERLPNGKMMVSRVAVKGTPAREYSDLYLWERILEISGKVHSVKT